MRTLKIACFLFASAIISVKASDTKPPIFLEDQSVPRKYSCLNERYRDFGSIVSDHCRENSRPYWLLSLDGGGVRALMHLLSLERLENITGKPISDLVDGISGTSSGGVLACLLTMRDPKTLRPVYSAKFLLDMMLPTRDKMFVRRWSSLWGLLGPRYRSGPLERYLGGLLMDDKFKSRSLPVVLVAHDLNSYSEKLISTTDAPDFRTKDLAVAISAAPTYFEPKVLRSISLPQVNHFLMDGATVMDNPVLAGVNLLQERHNVTLKNINVLSFGTGVDSTTHSSEGLIHSGFLGWGRKIVGICREGQLSTTDSLARFYLKDRYHRFQPLLGEGNLHLVDTSDEYLHLLRRSHLKMLEDKNEEIIRIAGSLMDLAKVKKSRMPAIIRPSVPTLNPVAKRSFSTLSAGRYFSPQSFQLLRRFCFRR